MQTTVKITHPTGTFTEQVFHLPARKAVIVAFAKALGDTNIAAYEATYGQRVITRSDRLGTRHIIDGGILLFWAKED